MVLFTGVFNVVVCVYLLHLNFKLKGGTHLFGYLDIRIDKPNTVAALVLIILNNPCVIYLQPI